MKNLYKFLFFGGSVVALLVIINVVSAEDILLTRVEVPDHLRLKASKDRILGSKELNGEVKYAYRSDVQVSSTPSNELSIRAQRAGLRLTEELINNRTKHARIFKTDGEGTYVTEIVSGVPQYYKDDNGVWWQAEYATTTLEAFNNQVAKSLSERIADYLLPKTHADISDPFYPDPDTEISSVDGRVQNLAASSWSTVRNAAAGTSVNDSATTQALNSALDGSDFVVSRGFTLFNTADIPDTATITSAVYSVYVDSKTNADNDGNDFFSVVTTNPSSNTSLATDDYDQVGSTEQHESSERKDVTSISTGTSTQWILNSIGIGNIAKTGITKFGLREGHDLLDDTPVGYNQIVINNAEAAGVNTDPKLVVVYTTSAFVSKFQARKNADQGATTTTLFADSELFLGLGSNKKYIIDGTIYASSTSAQPDLKIGFGFPSGVTVDLGYIAATDGAFRRAELFKNSSSTSQRLILAASGSPVIIQIQGTISVGNSSSTINFLWAQQDASASPTTLLRGSYLRAEEIIE